MLFRSGNYMNEAFSCLQFDLYQVSPPPRAVYYHNQLAYWLLRSFVISYKSPSGKTHGPTSGDVC